MVQSGLDNELIQRQETPRVSPYRLAAHLTSALAIYCTSFYTAMQVLSPHTTKHSLHTIGLGVFGIAATTITSGAFVAGLDAGLVYNTWPNMGESFVPPSNELLYLSPKWRNIFENQTTVQFDHRMLAYTTLASVFGLFGLARKRQAPPHITKSIKRAMHMVLLQASLGISTVLYLVPLPLAVLHQAGSVGVLTTMMMMLHKMRVFS